MAIKEFRLPDPGEGLVEADIVTWHVKVGDRVKVNDIVVEVETSKSLVELPIPFEGTVSALLVSEGDTVDVGTPIIAVSDGAAESGVAAGEDMVPELPAENTVADPPATGAESADDAGGSGRQPGRLRAEDHRGQAAPPQG